jgi:Uma2 family endonuclease
MITQEVRSLEDFQRFASLPENEDRLFEFINGEIIEVSPGRTWNSGFGHKLAIAAYLFCKAHGIPCYTSGEQGAYQIQGHVVVPDFAYKHTPLSKDYPDPVAPEWAVEVISPTDKASEIRAKREIYQAAGILYWEMYPDLERIDVYAPGQPARSFSIDDVLDGGQVLPGFTLPVRDLLGSAEESQG